MSWQRRGRRLLRRILPPRTGAVILGYHRLAEPDGVAGGDPFSLCVSPEAFRKQMRMLRNVGRPVALTQLMEAADAGVSLRGMIAVTFDDAYEEVLTVALPELSDLQIPCTVFFIAGCMGRPLWWDRLAALLAEAETGIPFRVEIDRFQFLWSGAGTPDELRVRLHRTLRILEDRDRERVLDHLEAVWGVELPSALPRTLTLDEAQTLVRSPLIEAGAHSVSHPPLTEVSPRRAEDEIAHARQLLGAALDREVSAFSYPHGSRSDRTDRLVKKAGYALACASTQDSVRPSTNKYALPRVWARDHSGWAFRRQVARYGGLRSSSRGST